MYVYVRVCVCVCVGAAHERHVPRANAGQLPEGGGDPSDARPPACPETVWRSIGRRQHLHRHRARAWRLAFRFDSHQTPSQAGGCHCDKHRCLQRHDIPTQYGHYPPRPQARQSANGRCGVAIRYAVYLLYSYTTGQILTPEEGQARNW